MKYAIALLSVFLVSCGSTSPSVKQPQDNYGTCGIIHGSFIGDWFDYYKRAITYMDCEKWPEAEQDLRQALAIRDQEKRRVYTLGMHFLNNYFPNRELGIALFKQQRYDDAVESLLKSYRQFPSEKARMFLVLAIQSSPKYQRLESLNPSATLSEQTDNAFIVSLQDDVYVDNVTVNSQPVLLRSQMIIDDITVTFVPFKPSLTLALEKTRYKGQTIELVITDVFGNQSELVLPPDIDMAPPSIALLSRSSEGNQLSWQFSVQDEQSNIKTAMINGQVVDIEKGTLSWTSEVTNLDIRLTDEKGNTGKYQFDATLAKALMVDAEASGVTTQEAQTLLSLYMASDKPLQALFIGEQKHTLSGALEQFSNLIYPLALGENQIDIEIQDTSGSQFKTLFITREAPLKDRPNEKLKLAVYPFDCAKFQSSNACLQGSDSFTPFFDTLEQRQRFDLLSRANLSQRIQALKLCEFDFSEKCIWEATQLVGSQAMLTVEVTRRNMGTVNDIELYAKVIDGVSGEILITFDAYQQLSDGAALDTRYLANKVLTYFPYISFTPNGDMLAIDNSSFDPWAKMPVFATQDKKVTFRGKLQRKGQTVTLPEANPNTIEKVYSL